MQFKLQRSPDGGHTIATDAAGNQLEIYLPENAGGAATGIRPMQVLIMGMAGCAAVDILVILKKQRQQVEDLRMDIQAEREPNKEPSLWQTVHVVFTVIGQVEQAKAEKAVELSMLKYCSVTETLRKAGADVTWEVLTQPAA
jgi:putative redox protein